MWINGPQWLCCDEKSWPKTAIPGINNDLPEVRKGICLLTNSAKSEGDSIKNGCEIFREFSSFNKLKRFVAYALYLKRIKSYLGSLQAQDLLDAETVIIKRVQGMHFAKEIKSLSTDKATKRDSRLLSLNLFLDNDDVIRMGGGLENSQPNSNHVTEKSDKKNLKTLCYLLSCKPASARILDGRFT